MGLVVSGVGSGERVTTGGKGRGEIRSKIGKVTGKAADVPSMDSLGKKV